MTIEDIQKRAIEAVGEAIKEVKELPLFPEKQHRALASQYPDGEKAYYDNEIMKLLKEAPNKCMLGNAWVNSGMPTPTMTQIADCILGVAFEVGEISINIDGWDNADEEGKGKLLAQYVKRNAVKFFRIYLAYERLKAMAKKANTKIDYALRPTYIAEIYEECYPDIIDCNFLTFANAIYNPDTFVNVGGNKSDLMIFMNVMAKFPSLGTEWKREACASKEWDVKECGKRSPKNEFGNTPEWYDVIAEMLKKH